MWNYVNEGGRFPFTEKSHLTWFGSKQTAEIYGPSTSYVLNQNITVIDMGSPQSIHTLKVIAGKQGKNNVIEALNETFNVVEKEVFRHSEAREDKIVANFLCSIFDCEKSSVQGWGHLSLTEFETESGEKKTFQPEVMLCCPYKVLSQRDYKAVNYTKEVLYSLIAQDKPYQRKQEQKRKEEKQRYRRDDNGDDKGPSNPRKLLF